MSNNPLGPHPRHHHLLKHMGRLPTLRKLYDSYLPKRTSLTNISQCVSPIKKFTKMQVTHKSIILHPFYSRWSVNTHTRTHTHMGNHLLLPIVTSITRTSITFWMIHVNTKALASLISTTCDINLSIFFKWNDMFDILRYQNNLIAFFQVSKSISLTMICIIRTVGTWWHMSRTQYNIRSCFVSQKF